MGKPGRRGNGQGTVYRRNDGAIRRHPWVAVVILGWTPSGKPVRRSRGAATREEAERLLEVLLAGRIPPRAGAAKNVPERPKRPKSGRRLISPRIRFLVLERDGFACSYCGARPPEAVLHIDHVVSRADAGADDIVNYRTACADCNLGKGPLSL